MRHVMAVLLILWPMLLAADAKPDAKLLDRWVGGKWVGEGEFVNSAYTKATKASGITTCAWSPDHVFLICDQNIKFGETPIRALAVYSFNPMTGRFKYSQIDLAGEPPHSTDLEINSAGDRWVYLGTGQDASKTLQFRTTNQFHGNDQVEWWSEVSSDGGKTWTKTGSGKESRQK